MLVKFFHFLTYYLKYPKGRINLFCDTTYFSTGWLEIMDKEMVQVMQLVDVKIWMLNLHFVVTWIWFNWVFVCFQETNILIAIRATTNQDTSSNDIATDQSNNNKTSWGIFLHQFLASWWQVLSLIVSKQKYINLQIMTEDYKVKDSIQILNVNCSKRLYEASR